MYINCVHAKGHVGIIKLQHAYANVISSKKSVGKGMSKEHIELFKAHDMARHGRILANATEFPLGGNFNPYVAGSVCSSHILNGIALPIYCMLKMTECM